MQWRLLLMPYDTRKNRSIKSDCSPWFTRGENFREYQESVKPPAITSAGLSSLNCWQTNQGQLGAANRFCHDGNEHGKSGANINLVLSTSPWTSQRCVNTVKCFYQISINRDQPAWECLHALGRGTSLWWNPAL